MVSVAGERLPSYKKKWTMAKFDTQNFSFEKLTELTDWKQPRPNWVRKMAMLQVSPHGQRGGSPLHQRMNKWTLILSCTNIIIIFSPPNGMLFTYVPVFY